MWSVETPERLHQGVTGWHVYIHILGTVRNPSAMQETWVRSLGWEDPLEEGMATPSSILAWRSPWTEEPGGVQFMGWQRVGLD